MKNIVKSLLLVVLFADSLSYSQIPGRRPPTECEDRCMREYATQSLLKENAYRAQLHNSANDAMMAVTAAWANYFDAPTSWATYASPVGLVYLNDNIYRNVAAADLEFYGAVGETLTKYNICMGACPAP